MNPNQEPEPNANQPENAAGEETDALSAEDEAFLAELEKESGAGLGGHGLEPCLSCALAIVLLLAVVKYCFS